MTSNYISDLADLVDKSKHLLEKDIVSFGELTDYKKNCASILIEIIKLDQNETITELALRGLKYKVIRIKNPVFRWFYNFITEGRDSSLFNAPFLRKKTDSDYHKTYIFWMKLRLEGIMKHLNEINN